MICLLMVSVNMSVAAPCFDNDDGKLSIQTSDLTIQATVETVSFDCKPFEMNECNYEYIDITNINLFKTEVEKSDHGCNFLIHNYNLKANFLTKSNRPFSPNLYLRNRHENPFVNKPNELVNTVTTLYIRYMSPIG